METAVLCGYIALVQQGKGTAFCCLLIKKTMTKKLHIVLYGIVLTMFSYSAFAQVNADKQVRSNKRNQDIPVNNETPTKNIEKIVGVWEATGIFNGTKDITETDTVGLNRSFEFTRENKYISYSDNEQIDSGAFKLNEVQNSIYLESAGGNEVAEYKVRFDNNTMTLQPSQSADANAQRFKYVYTRKREEN
jgi:hypothetical protein